MDKSAYLTAMMAFIGLTTMTGCQRELKPIELRAPEKVASAEKSRESGEKVKWEDLKPEGSGKAETRPRFIAASEAQKAPKLNLQRFNGQDIRVDPARDGKVTAVVFWAMDTITNRAAVIHISQLVKKYRRSGLRAMNVVVKPPTNSHRAAPKFLRSHDVDLPTFYDDFDALQEMADAADISIDEEVPLVFLIDKKGRVRFSKLGFSYTRAGAPRGPGAGLRLTENAPPGKRIEDYIKGLLKEK